MGEVHSKSESVTVVTPKGSNLPGTRPKVSRKIVIVGDGACGKTCLLLRAKDGMFMNDHVPTVFETCMKTLDHPNTGEACELVIWDTAGQEDYDRLRPLSYADVHVILLCYSIDAPDSFQNITEKWVPELKYWTPGVAFILVGCKADTRSPDGLDMQVPVAVSPIHVPPSSIQSHVGDSSNFIKTETGQWMSKHIQAADFLECSALTGYNVNKLFETVVMLALTANQPSKPKWSSGSMMGGNLTGQNKLLNKTSRLTACLLPRGNRDHQVPSPPLDGYYSQNLDQLLLHTINSNSSSSNPSSSGYKNHSSLSNSSSLNKAAAHRTLSQSLSSPVVPAHNRLERTRTNGSSIKRGSLVNCKVRPYVDRKTSSVRSFNQDTSSPSNSLIADDDVMDEILDDEVRAHFEHEILTIDSGEIQVVKNFKKSLRTSKSLNGASFSTDISNQPSSGRGSSVTSSKNRNSKNSNGRKNSNNSSSDTDMDLASELEKLKVQDNNSLETKSQNWGTCGNGDSAISLGKSLGRTFTK